MSHQHTLRTATNALRRNVMRAALTTLGIVIGIGAVITMVEIGRGSATAIQNTITTMGANTLLILPGQAASGGVSFGAGSSMTLRPDDCDAILADCPAVAAATPIVTVRAQVVYGNQNWVPMNINGTTPAFLEVRNWTNLAEGECFTNRDVRNYSKVCLLGQTLVRELFQGESPIGKEVRIRSISFKVVGVLQKKGANMMGWDQDDIVVAPWTSIKYRVAAVSSSMSNASASSGVSSGVNTLDQIYPAAGANEILYPPISDIEAADTPPNIRFTTVNQILASARSGEAVAPAIRQITALLHERHRIKAKAPNDFQIRDMTEMINALTSTSGLMRTLLLCVAAISLVVGGVGIMNIMLVSVTERTREIGLRMAVGARPRDILWQFLAEAVALCFCGGVIGIALGKTGSYLVTKVMHWPTEGSVAVVVVAVLVSASVGVCFGFYPAWKASRLDPIDALRYE